MALSSCTQEGMWLKQLDDEIFNTTEPINLLCDNQSTIQLAENIGYSAQCKHIDIRHQYYVNTNENAADAFKKPLVKCKFEECRKLFGLI